MKTAVRFILAALLLVSLLSALVACGEKKDPASLWENALYTADATVGEGSNSVTVTIEAGDKSVVLTVKTDKATLGEALFENGITNDPSFFSVCNGIPADWDADRAYWAFYVDDTLSVYGVADAQASVGYEGSYRIVYTTSK